MRVEKGEITYKDLGYDRNLSKRLREGYPAVLRGDMAYGDLKGVYPRPTVNWDNNTKFLGNFSTILEPTYEEGIMYYNTDRHKMYIGGETGWEELTSTVVPSESFSPSESPSSSISPSKSPSLSPSISPSVSPSTP